MNQYERDLWPVVARIVLGFFTTVLGALFLLDLAVFFKFEFVSMWTYFAMFFGTLLWFIILVVLLLEHKTNGRKHKKPYQFLIVEAVCAVALGLSASGLIFSVMTSSAIIADTLATFAFLAIFVRLSMDKFNVH